MDFRRCSRSARLLVVSRVQASRGKVGRRPDPLTGEFPPPPQPRFLRPRHRFGSPAERALLATRREKDTRGFRDPAFRAAENTQTREFAGSGEGNCGGSGLFSSPSLWRWGGAASLLQRRDGGGSALLAFDDWDPRLAKNPLHPDAKSVAVPLPNASASVRTAISARPLIRPASRATFSRRGRRTGLSRPRSP